MNRLGRNYIQKYVHKNDIVLDLGCGIMQATSDTISKGKLKCNTILGVELHEKYIDRIKNQYPTVKLDVRNTEVFADNSFDVVICTDVLEHLRLTEAIELLAGMKRITRKYVLIFTPQDFDHNGDNIDNAWDMGENKLQQHQCLVTQEILKDLDYTSEIINIDDNIFGVYEK